MNTDERKLIQNLKRIQDEKDFIVAFEEVHRIFGEDTRKVVPQKIWGRYQNIIWRDRHEEWVHDGQRYMSGDNFRDKDEWYEVEAHEEDKPYSPHWRTLYSYRLVYFRGGVYKSVSWGRYEKIIFLYSQHGDHGFMMNVTSCAPVLPIIGK